MKKYQCKIKKIIFCFLIICIQHQIISQNINLEQIVTGKPFKVSGTVSANSVFYNANQEGGRDPFTYFVQGALNFSLYQFSMPVSYSYSNQGENLDYQIPFKFNRLSLHPKYKWVQAHIGDVNMTFSPYTLSAHQFTGGGLELSPKGGLKFSAMSGRLLKAVENDEDPRTIPAFKRMGYGSKISFNKNKFKLGIIGFYAKDEINSIAVIPDEKGVTPKENLVVSLEGAYKISKNLEVKAEYASSALTQDLRAEDSSETGNAITGSLFNNKTSTSYFTAIKTALDYKFSKYSVGVAYERIDPGYETLGAYFFNNDFENITLNTTSTLFKDKVNLSFNIGYQRDDLKQQKETATSRTVGSVNASFSASKNLNITGSYSNFSTFTNLKTNQFDIINDDNLLDNAQDALDYKQLSQNANLNVNYVISKKKDLQQNINFNYALADVSNEQGGIVRIGDASTFHNINTSYTLGFPNLKLNITPAVNATYNTIGREDAFTWGPTLAINKKFLENTLNTSFATSYNNSKNNESNTSILNFRASTNYIYKKKHNFNLSAVQLIKTSNTKDIQSLTITFGYNYVFDITGIRINKPAKREKIKVPKKEKTKTPKVKKEKKKKTKKQKKSKPFSFTYKEHTFKGEPQEIALKIIDIATLDKFKSILKISILSKELKILEEKLVASKSNKKRFKAASIKYLKFLSDKKEFKDKYDNLVFNSFKKLFQDAKRMDSRIKESYLQIQAKVNNAVIKDQIDINNLKKKKNQYDAHLWMMDKLNKVAFNDVKNDIGLLKIFKDKYINKVFELLENGTKEIEIKNYLEGKLIELYHKEALKKTSE